VSGSIEPTEEKGENQTRTPTCVPKMACFEPCARLMFCNEPFRFRVHLRFSEVVSDAMFEESDVSVILGWSAFDFDGRNQAQRTDFHFHSERSRDHAVNTLKN
jgi:hypothetical protein